MAQTDFTGSDSSGKQMVAVGGHHLQMQAEVMSRAVVPKGGWTLS